jgi:hypothetical protein
MASESSTRITVKFDFDRLLTRAIFSEDRRYRFSLPRMFDPRGAERADRLCLFVMLNPSTADDERNDPTVTRAIGYAQGWGYDGLLVGNVYGFRSTDPRALRGEKDPVGIENDAYLCAMACLSSLIVCAWGTHVPDERADAVRSLLEQVRPLHFLRLNKGGSPCHPLYLPSALKPQPWNRSSATACD